MENRRELSEKSRKLIAKQFKSDILNTSTGYYKKEMIFPVTPKPNEVRPKVIEFIPKYKEIKPSEMWLNNLLSDQQKHNNLIMQNLKQIENKKNPELEALRQREKTIKDNCYDRRGNFSARKRHLLEFYGIETMYNTARSLSNSKSIKEARKLNRSFFIQKIPKSLDINSYDKESFKDNYNYTEYSNRDNTREKNNNDAIDIINQDDTINKGNKEDNIILNGAFINRRLIIKNKMDKKFNKKSRNNNIFKIKNNLSGTSNNLVNSFNIKNHKEKGINRIILPVEDNNKSFNNTKKNLNMIKYSLEKQNKKKINQKQFFHPKDLNKVFYTQTNKPAKSNRLDKSERDNEEKEYFNIEIKQLEPLKKDSMNEKKIKEIFCKNGLHIYDFNQDGMNILKRDKKMEAKLRKNKKDENFDRNYRKAIRELNKINIGINKTEIMNEKGFKSKEIRKKRKGTPGKVLFNKKEQKDENTKLNTGFGFKRDKDIIPQKNNNYKNLYNYKMNHYNHKNK
jgi:hypothetical protein